MTRENQRKRKRPPPKSRPRESRPSGREGIGRDLGWTPGGKVLATGEQRTLADPGVGVITGFADAFGSSGLVDMVPWEAVGSSGPMTAEVSKVEICSRPGDSGAPVWRDGEVVGVLSAASPQTARTECAGERVSFVADITGGRLG